MQINDISGSYGGAGKIFLDIDTVFESLRRLMVNLDGFPDPDAVAVSLGPSHDVAAEYSRALARATDRARQATVNTRDHLLEMDQAIREVVAALTAHDVSAASDASLLLEFMTDAKTDAESAPPADPTLGTDSTAGDSAAFGSLS